MATYQISKEQFKAVSELKQKFGNVSLNDLYKNSVIVDINGKPMPKTTAPSIEEACRDLTDRQIERLLLDKINNICIYANYKLGDHDAGFLARTYNDVPVDLISPYTDAPQKMKSILESRYNEVDVVATAMKTIEKEAHKGYAHFCFWTKYAPYSPYSCSTIIFRDKITGQFHALGGWICNWEEHNPRWAARTDLSNFIDRVIKEEFLQSKIVTDMQKRINIHREIIR